METNRFWRQLDLCPPDKLTFPVAVIGAGAIGSATVVTLAKMGCSDITVWDEDDLAEHNFASQMCLPEYVGFPKVDALAHLVEMLTGTQIRPVSSHYRGQRLEGVVISAVDSMTDLIEGALRGYCGWLMTNRQFLAEHDGLFQTWRVMVRKYGIPKIGMMHVGPHEPPQHWHEAKGRVKKFLDAFEEFFLRWRLVRLSAPGLPEPIGPGLAPLPRTEVLRRMQMGGPIYHLPDIFPIPSRDELRDALENARLLDIPEHVKEWSDLIRSGNKGKKRIYAFARRFELQHFWRVLYERHADALLGEEGSVHRAFATFLYVSAETIRKDVQDITRRLGTDWYTRT